MSAPRIIDGYERIMAVVHADTIEKLTRAATGLRDISKTYCPVRTGALKKSIRMKVFPNELMARVYVGNNKVRHANLVLFGTAPRRTKGSPAGWGGKKRVPHSTGSTRPNNFMKEAFEGIRPELEYIFGKKITVDMK